jgi:O-antigen ligase
MIAKLFPLFIIGLLIPLWVKLRRDPVGGLAYAVFCCLTLTPDIRLMTPGALPELTIHRLILLSLLVPWLRSRRTRPRVSSVPAFRQIVVWIIVSFVSLLGSIDRVYSLKRFLDFVLEMFLFYFILATWVREPADGLRVLRAAWLGLTVVGVMAIIERYSGMNVVENFLYYLPYDPEGRHDVRATYRHRILLGTAMSMGWPLAFALMYQARLRARQQWMLWVSVGILLTASYLSMSRGPWLASVIAVAVIAFFGSVRLRKTLALLAALMLIGLLLQPGVGRTIVRYARKTTETQTIKGASFLYRFELWRIAWTEVSLSPWRLAFGYGPGSGGVTELEWQLSYRDRSYPITSWDNDLAYTLYQTGVTGLCATLALYLTVAGRVFGVARGASFPERDMLLCTTASVAVLLFMMTNVHIFARQLYYLLWTLAAGTFAVGAPETTEAEPTPPDGSG